MPVSGTSRIVPGARPRSLLADQKRSSHDACCDEACQLEVGEELAAPRDVARAARRLEQARAGGDLGACLGLGCSYKEGRGVAKDEARARRLGARARELFRAYERSAADPFDPEQAVDRAGF